MKRLSEPSVVSVREVEVPVTTSSTCVCAGVPVRGVLFRVRGEAKVL